MLRKLINPNTINKILTAKTPAPTFFKNIDWNLKKVELDKLSKPIQTILKEMEKSSSSDAPGPLLKNNR